MLVQIRPLSETPYATCDKQYAAASNSAGNSSAEIDAHGNGAVGDNDSTPDGSANTQSNNDEDINTSDDQNTSDGEDKNASDGAPAENRANQEEEEPFGSLDEWLNYPLPYGAELDVSTF